MYPSSTPPKVRFSLPRLVKQATVAAVTGALMFAGVAPAAAAPDEPTNEVTVDLWPSTSVQFGGTAEVFVHIINWWGEPASSSVTISPISGLEIYSVEPANCSAVSESAVLEADGTMRVEVGGINPGHDCFFTFRGDVTGSGELNLTPSMVSGTGFTNEITGRTITITPGTFNTKPTGFTHTMVTPDRVAVTWVPPATTSGHGPVTRYSVDVFQVGAEDPGSFGGLKAEDLPYEFDVIQGESYTFVVTGETPGMTSTVSAEYTVDVPVSMTAFNALLKEAANMVKNSNYSAYHRARLVPHLLDPLKGDPSFESVKLNTALLQSLMDDLVNVAALRSAHESATKSGDFTASSWEPHETALSVAVDLLSQAAEAFDITQGDVDAATSELIVSEALLVDLSDLRAQTLAPFAGEYTYASYMAYAGPLSAASDILNDAVYTWFHVSQADVDTLTADLISAYDELADLSKLRTALDSAMTVTGEPYLKHGWSAFVSARSHANTVLGAASTDKAGLDAALNALADTRAALVHNLGLHDVIADSRLKDEARYGTATWARYAAALDALKDLAATDLEERPVSVPALSAAVNEYYFAQAALLELPPLVAATDDFADLNPSHYASVAFGELAAIVSDIDRVIADSGDPAKIGMPGDQFLLPRYWAKRAELADIRALTAAFQRIDVINHSKHTAHSVEQLRSARFEAKTVVDTWWVTDSDVEDLVDTLAELEAALVRITPLEDSLVAAAALDERLYKVDLWSELATDVAAGKLLLADTADLHVPITRAEIASAAQAITDAIHRLEITPPLITVGGSPIKDGQSIQAGAELAIAGDLLEGGSAFRAELHSTPTLLGSVTAGTDGTAILNVRIPVNTPAGNHALHVFGTAVDGTPIHHTVGFTIVAGPGSSSNLARTGAELAPLYAGGGLIAVGALLILIRRRYAVR